MLQRAAGNAYSWWAASHIRTKQSKWLDNDLEEMEDRVKSMLKIIEEDGDSFAKKAEMYFKKRPELVHFVEETYKAYRALAEKYDHISGELHKANHTIATAFPDQVQFDMQDEEDDNLLKVNTPIDSSKMRKPSAEIPQISLMNKKKENQPALKKSRLARVTSQSNKDMAQVEIDRLQKGILVLQTEKEFIKSSYESGIAKYWEIEKQITEMQEEVFSLQDEFSASVVIEDDEARALMAVTALKSCEDTLVNLQEQQKRSIEEARIESERIKIAKEKLKACKGESAQSETTEISDESREMSFTTVNMEEEVSSQKQSLESQSICVEVKEHVEISSDSSVVELAEKINELVTKVISLELTASSQTAQIKSLRLEADVLHKHLQSFEEEKKTLIDDSNSLRDRLKQAEEKLQRTQDLEECARDEKSVGDKNSTEARLSVGDISEELMSPKHHDQVNIAGPSQVEVTSLHNIESARDSEEKEVKEILELEDCFQDEKSMIDKNSAEAFLSPVDISEKVMSPKHQDQVNIVVPSQEEVTFLHNIEAPRECENREVKESLDTVDNLVEEEQVNIAGPSQALHNIEAPRDTEKKEVKEILDTVNNLVEEESQGIEELGLCLKDQKVFDHSETGSLLEDGSIKFRDPKQEVEIRTSQAGVSIHPSKEPRIQLGEQEVSLNWLHSLVDGLEGKEKILLAEYTSILRNYKEAKKRLSEVEKKNQEYLFETTTQLRELKSANAMKDEKIQSLLQNIRFLQSNSYKNADIRLQEIERSSNLQKPNISEDLNLEAIAKKDASFEISDGSPIGDEDIKLSGTDGQHPTSAVEEKFRRDIDTLLEENLEFWLRFSTSFDNIQKFQTAFEDLQAEIEKLNDSKLEEGSSHSAAQEGMNLESPPIDRRLRELKTELEVWLEQNVLLQGELQSRFSSLCSIQEEISGALEASLEGDGVQFAPYQAAKFQGELLNMQLENNKVADELQAGLDHVSGLQAEVEKTMSKLHEKFEPSGSKASHHNHFRHFSTRSKVPLRSFLFGAKPKKKPSIFACVNPALQKQFGDMATRRPT